jgi:hypothetical protein
MASDGGRAWGGQCSVPMRRRWMGTGGGGRGTQEAQVVVARRWITSRWVAASRWGRGGDSRSGCVVLVLGHSQRIRSEQGRVHICLSYITSVGPLRPTEK